MIPEQMLSLTELEETQYATKTYKLDTTLKRVVGNVDDMEAVTQSIIKILETERYSNVIYNGEYGVELESLIGQDFDYVISDLPRRLEEALMIDDRILGVDEFEYTRDNDSLTVSLIVNTIYGELPITTEVGI